MVKESGSSVVDKLSRPLNDLRISVTDRCNLRCTFCMPQGKDYEFYPREDILRFEEIVKVVRACKELGVKKVRITGGEPLLRKDLEKLISMIKEEGIGDITLTTNGFLLKEKARLLASAGLKRVTVSFHSLKDETFSRVVGKQVKVSEVLDGIRSAMDAGLTPVKVNVCVVKGLNDGEVVDIAEFFKKMGVVVRFIEFMDVGTLNGWSLERVVSAKEILQMLSRRFRFRALGRSYGETAMRFVYEDEPLEFGIIPSITEPFCGDCNRLRLTADGHLFTCLFGTQGWDIKSLIRNGATQEELRDFIRRVWKQRQDRYSEERLTRMGEGLRKVEMFKLGG